MTSVFRTVAIASIFGAAVCAQSVYNNGPFVTGIGTGNLGADVSMYIAPLTTVGFTCASDAANLVRLADDFVVPCGEVWSLNTLKAYGCVTNAASVSPVTTAVWRIWKGRPDLAGSSVLYDATGSNQLISTAFTNVYRVGTAAPTSNVSPIFEFVMSGNGAVLGAGTYWFEYGVTTIGNVAFLSPPITIVGTNATGDARVGVAPIATGTFSFTGPINSVLYPQGLPFSIDYNLAVANCYAFSITQAGVGGAVTFANSGGAGPNVYINVLTANLGLYPNGWFAGVDIPFAEFFNEFASGPPFYGLLDGAGSATLTIPGPIPSGLTFYAASIEFGLTAAVGVQSAFTFTTL